MKISRAGFLVVACIVAAGCRDRASNLQREQQQYDVVQEGAANGTSTALAAPGEAPPTATTSTYTGMTATNADTTTAFTLPGTAATTDSAQPGTLGSTLPAPGSGNISGYSRPRPRRPVQTSTSAPPVPPAQTDTAAPATTTQSSPALEPSSNPPPAPPTTTDTRGM